jgi:hypothetical protein
MSTERLVTRKEAGRLCGCSVDSIRRRQAEGDFPNARLDDGAWMIPVSDLVAAGHLDPTAPTESAPPAPDETAADAARIARLEAELARAESEIAFQRDLLMQLATRPLEPA